jgi:hypothetical protein
VILPRDGKKCGQCLIYFSRQDVGLGWLATRGTEEAYNANFFDIANTGVLFIGFLLLLIAVLIRTRVEGPAWIRWYMPEDVYRRYLTQRT